MSREILEAMHALAREKGIEPEKLMIALEDALLPPIRSSPARPSTRAWKWIAKRPTSA